MTSCTSTRRVLGDLNVNTPVGKNPLTGSPLKAAAAPLKNGGENATPFSDKMQLGEGEGTNVHRGSSGKRAEDLPVVDDGEKAAKRRKTGHGDGVEDDDAHEFLSPSPQSSPSVSTSPSSSAGNMTGELNDTQNTTFTLPDDFIYHANIPPTSFTQSAPLKPEELRAKARAIRLRLSLASYKVRTNQIDVPISRLEVRSSQTLPQLRRTASTTSHPSTSQAKQEPKQQDHHRTALPSAPGSPLLQSPPHHHAARQRTQHADADADIPSSPPVPSHPASAPVSPTKGPRDGFATPILPRQREALLNPPLLSADMETDLTSSVVKGRAADGLLCLMRMTSE